MIIYIVQPGDTLGMIANRFNVTIQKIIEHNWVGTDMMIVPGKFFLFWIIICMVRRVHGSPFNAAALYKAGGPYVVQRGDTLAAIARRFDSTVEGIVEANHLEGPNDVIYPGQILRIPIIGFR